MQAFYVFLTLSSLTGPQVLFVSQPQPGTDPLACLRSLKKVEGVVGRIIQYDAPALELF